MTIAVSFLVTVFSAASVSAATPGLDSVQMQRLIRTAEHQLEVAREMLKQNQQDSANQERVLAILEQLSKGIEMQIQPLQGSTVYDQALLKLQEDADGALKQSAIPRAGETDEQAKARENFVQFQMQSHKADFEDIVNRNRLAEALAKAPPGFVPKLQTQAELGQWQTNVRISAKLTELLSAIQGLRRDLRGGRSENRPEGFGLFLSGAAEQSKKQRQEVNRVP